jgi:hypothetical protein
MGVGVRIRVRGRQEGQGRDQAELEQKRYYLGLRMLVISGFSPETAV